MASFDDLLLLFPDNAQVLALPDEHRPRLLIAGKNFAERWALSNFLPAYRYSAQPIKWLYRCRAALGSANRRRITGSDPEVARFIAECLPGNQIGALLLREVAGDYKLTAQIHNEQGQVTAYLKYAITERGKMRLLHEREILESLNENVCPQVLREGMLASGYGLLLRAVPGKAVPARLPPYRGLLPLLRLIASGGEPKADPKTAAECALLSIEQHPWCQALQRRSPRLTAWITMLQHRQWPVVTNHGDCAPWNILRHGTQCRAIDWEFGNRQGFPYLDLLCFLVQTASLIYRWAPAKTWSYLLRYLARATPLSEREMDGLIRLICYLLHARGQEEGRADGEPAQQWRRAMWEWQR